jgi:hypothetical protein
MEKTFHIGDVIFSREMCFEQEDEKESGLSARGDIF